MMTHIQNFFASVKKLYNSPWILLLALILFLIGAPCVSSFKNAMTPVEAIHKGYPTMPPNWEAGVFSHGDYYQWYTIQKHPIGYAFSLVILWSGQLLWASKMLQFYLKSRNSRMY
ncbi:MAG TPA: hypothetical protein PKC11_12575 [Agitococcus sp.]|nr:hypothetical protein [Agitococcus sp.]